MKNIKMSHPELMTYVEFLSPSSVILDIKTTGRFWRTSQIEEIHLVASEVTGPAEYVLISEKEEDEYDMLICLSEKLSSFDTIITFNGNAFDLPHLKNKYKAYGLADPFPGKSFRDLFLEYKEYEKLLGLPSRKLNDYAVYMGAQNDLSDASKTLVVLSLDALTSLFDGNWAFISADRDEDHVYYNLSVEKPFLKRISIADETYFMIMKGNSIKLSSKIENEKLRRYYTDYKNYYYLPIEGYAIHKSMASFVEKSHKEKAVRENCFSLISYSDRFLNDQQLIQTYISSVLQYLRSR